MVCLISKENWTKILKGLQSKGLRSFHTINMFLWTEIVVLTFKKMKITITYMLKIKKTWIQNTLALRWFLLVFLVISFFIYFRHMCDTWAVIIAGSVKESGCNNILHLSVVTRKWFSDAHSWLFQILSDNTFCLHPVNGEAKFEKWTRNGFTEQIIPQNKRVKGPAAF